MKFNQVIWDALCFAACRPSTPEQVKAFAAALEEYAAACDGRADITYKWGAVYLAYFVPNPIPQY